MSSLVPERTAADAADYALISVRAFVSTVPNAYRGEGADPRGISVIIPDLITSLLHLADATGAPGDREEFALMAYSRYREEAVGPATR